MTVNSELIARVHEAVGEALTERLAEDEANGQRRLSPEDERALTHKLISDEIQRLAADAYKRSEEPLSDAEELVLTLAVFDRVHGLGRIQPLIDHPDYSDIHIAGHGTVWIQLRNGTKIRGEPVADSDDELIDMIATAARRLGRSERRFDYANPELDLQLPNGDRLHALMAVSSRPNVTIRRHDFSICRLDQVIDLGAIDTGIAEFLRAAVRAALNIIVAGGTGTGKTTMLRCLINEIPPEERLITVEDALEIGLERFSDLHPDYETLEAHKANTEGVGVFTMAELVRSGLRMDPHRVIVGEVRGPEVLPMLLCMSQGNDGSMCSVHADSSKGVFSRLAMYAAMTTERLEPQVTNLLVANAVDVVVHIGWINGVRRVTSIREVVSAEGDQVVSNEVWRPGADGRAVPGYPLRDETLARLERHGFDRDLLTKPDGWWSS